MASRWTDESRDYVRYWYSEVGIPFDMLADDLGRSEAAVRQEAKKMGLEPPPGGMAVGPRRAIGRIASETGVVTPLASPPQASQGPQAAPD